MSSTHTSGLHRSDLLTIRGLAIIAALITTALFIWRLIGGISLLAAGETSLELLTRAEVPNLGTPGAENAPGIVSAGFETAHVVATGLDTATRVLLTTSAFADALTIAAVGGAIAWFLFLFAAQRPFQRSLFVTTLSCGIALIFGPIIANGLRGLALMQAATELNPLAHDVFIAGFAIDATSAVIPGIGFVVLALAYVFRAGERMQHDTAGLV